MARIFVTGSSTGLGLMAAKLLVEQGHQVVLHGRDQARAQHARRELPAAENVLVGDLSSIAATRRLAGELNRSGRFDAVIHNAGVGYREARRIETENGLAHVFAVNVLAPYILTALVERPDRLVYLSSGMHHGVRPALEDAIWTRRSWRGADAYAESKLYDTVLAFAVARLWPEVLSNAVEPGWVPTRMGGAGAPDDLMQGHVTQAWLAVSGEAAARVTGGYFYHQHPRAPNPEAQKADVQDKLLDVCRELSGITFPGHV